MTPWTYLRHSVRGLFRTPAATAVLVASIALGVGSNAVIAALVRGLVTSDLRIEAPERAVGIFARAADGSVGPASFELYAELEQRTDLFERLGAAAVSRTSIALDERAATVTIASITPAAAELLGLSLGDGVVIGHRLWRDALQGNSTEGRQVSIDGRTQAITGVAPEWLIGIFADRPVDIWIRADAGGASSDAAVGPWWILGRLAGFDAVAAQQQVNSGRSGNDLLAVLPYAGLHPEAAAAQRRIGILLTTAGGFVLLIACANVATYLLARGMVRARETAVRVAIGVTRRQLAAGLLADALILAVVGGAAGMLVALWTSDILPALLFEQDASELQFVIDRQWLLLASALCLGALVVCGLAPLLEVRHDDPAAVLRRESAGPSPRGRSMRMALAVGQMTICCILLIAAALLIVRFRGALQTATGQRLGPSLLVTADAGTRFSRPDLGRQYFAEVEQAAFSVGEAHEAAWTATPPGGHPASLPVRAEVPPLVFTPMTIESAAFTAASLAEIDPTPVAGRLFGGVDVPNGCRVLVINESGATQLFGGDALGRVVQDPLGGLAEIVGVVAMRPRPDGRHRLPFVYYYAPQLQDPEGLPARQIYGVSAGSRGRRHVLDQHVVSANYLRLVEATVVQGAALSDDRAEGACRTGVVNDEAAQQLFGGSAVGGAVIDANGQRTTITGVVSRSTLGVNQRAEGPALYLSTAEEYVPRMTLLLRVRDQSEEVRARLAAAVTEVKGAALAPRVVPLDAHLARTALSSERIAAVLVSASATIGSLLGLFGLYGALTDAGRQRRREFAVRSALGARAWHIIREVLRDGLRFAAGGAMLGLLASVFVDRWLIALLPHSSARPLLAWVVPPAVLLVGVLLASALPARRAMAVSPLSLMKED